MDERIERFLADRTFTFWPTNNGYGVKCSADGWNEFVVSDQLQQAVLDHITSHHAS